MALIPTSQTSIDHKLHCIMLKSFSGSFASSTDLARSLQDDEPGEFSYERKGATYFSGTPTIQKYIRYAQAIAILNEKLKPSAKDDAVFRGLDAFQNWLGNKVVQYFNDNQCSPNQIKDAIRSLLQETTARLPTPDNVLDKLKRPVSRENFITSVKLISILRPQVLELAGSRRIIVNNQVIRA